MKLLLIYFILGIALQPFNWAGADCGTAQESVKVFCEKATAENYAANVHVNAEKVGAGYGPYDASLSPDLNTRMAGVHLQELESCDQVRLGPGFVPDICKHDFSSYFHKLSESPAQYPSDFKKKYSDNFSKLYNGINNPDRTAAAKNAAAFIVCPKNTTYLKCKAAFAEGVTKLNPGGLFLAPEIYTEVMTNPAYVQPLSRVIAKLYDNMGLAKQNRLTDPGDLYNDLLTAFKQSGVSNTVAEDMTWNVLELYSGRGAAADYYYAFSKPENFPVVASLGLLASMTAYFDRYSLEHHLKIYSLPVGVSTSCDYTRPYHFWLAAYLAHGFKKEGYSDQATFEAVHELEKTYEEFGGAATKKSLSSIAKDSPHGSYEVETQKNIAFNDAGAIYGIQPGSHVDLDQDLEKLYSSSANNYYPAAPTKLIDNTLNAINNLYSKEEDKISLKYNLSHKNSTGDPFFSELSSLGVDDFLKSFRLSLLSNWEALIPSQDSLDWGLAQLNQNNNRK
jgi:hypothetical protein